MFNIVKNDINKYFRLKCDIYDNYYKYIIVYDKLFDSIKSADYLTPRNILYDHMLWLLNFNKIWTFIGEKTISKLFIVRDIVLNNSIVNVYQSDALYDLLLFVQNNYKKLLKYVCYIPTDFDFNRFYDGHYVVNYYLKIMIKQWSQIPMDLY